MLYNLGKLSVNSANLRASLNTDTNSTLGFILTIVLANSLTSKRNKITQTENSIKIDFNFYDAGLLINLEQNEDMEFYKFRWHRPANPNPQYLEDKIYFGQTSWYGGPYLLNHNWPIGLNDEYNMAPYVLNDIFQDLPTGQERYWLCSKKIALNVPWNIPLWTQVQDGQLTLRAHRDSPFFTQTSYLEYEIAVPKKADSMTLKEFHLKSFHKYLKAPLAVPDRLMIEKPIWSTWAVYFSDIDQAKVIDYARGIVEHKFPISHLELDDKWTSAYGDYEVDTQKFPDFPGMIRNLSEMGVPRLTAWVHPFINPKSKNGSADEAKNGNNIALQEFFVKDVYGNVKTQTWWTGDGYVLDMTNPDATNWFRQQLERLQKLGIYTYKFDGGEASFLPDQFSLYSGTQPNDFGTAYAKFAASFGPAVENRFGSASQESSIFLRTMDRNSFWNQKGGLNTLIPWMLSLSLHGYYWNLPDMVGGNAYSDVPGEQAIPEKELFIRWTQANIFMMAIQFSYTPWQYDDETIGICREMLDLREKWLPYIMESAEKAVKEREPIMRPIWWNGDDLEAFKISDQFLVGERLLVAPVLEKGAFSRTVLLPPGKWKDSINGSIYETSVFEYIDIDAPLNKLPYFERIDITTTTTTTTTTSAKTTSTSLISTTTSQNANPNSSEVNHLTINTVIITIIAIFLMIH